MIYKGGRGPTLDAPMEHHSIHLIYMVLGIEPFADPWASKVDAGRSSNMNCSLALRAFSVTKRPSDPTDWRADAWGPPCDCQRLVPSLRLLAARHGQRNGRSWITYPWEKLIKIQETFTKNSHYALIKPNDSCAMFIQEMVRTMLWPLIRGLLEVANCVSNTREIEQQVISCLDVHVRQRTHIDLTLEPNDTWQNEKNEDHRDSSRTKRNVCF